MLVKRTLLSALPLALALVLAAWPDASRAAEEPSEGPAVIVLDGSGSMWGNVGAEKPAKFDLARAALREALMTLSPRVRLGLMSFGHRRRADCSDVEVLAPPEAGPPERLLAITDTLSPKGKGPLALTLREAAKEIPAGEAGSIIVVHDGLDNCWQDPCAVAEEIAAANRAVRIFLIGFGLDKGDAQRLQCVAKATNGQVFDAQSSTRLSEALSEALTAAHLARADAATGLAVPAPQPATPPPPAGAPGVKLTVALAAGGPPLPAAVSWNLFKASDPATAIKTVRGKDLVADLDPGSYVAEVRFGQASVREPIEVAAAGATVKTLTLGAGYLKLNALADKSGTPLKDPLITVVSKDSSESRRQTRWIGRDPTARLVVPAGNYAVEVRDGLAAETADVMVAPGGSSEAAPVLGTGQISLSAVIAGSGAPLPSVTYVIEEDDPDSPQGRREVARSAAPVATFTLPPGTYYVTARSGVGEVHERIALGSGDSAPYVARFNLVPITISVIPVGGADAAPADRAHPVLIRVLAEDGTSREVARAYGASGSFALPPARYRVEASVSGLNVAARGIIDLSNGKGGTTQLKLEHGDIAISQGARGGVSWRVKDTAGHTVMHSGPGGTARARLAPGRYLLLTETDHGVSERPIDLKAGDELALSLDGAP